MLFLRKSRRIAHHDKILHENTLIQVSQSPQVSHISRAPKLTARGLHHGLHGLGRNRCLLLGHLTLLHSHSHSHSHAWLSHAWLLPLHHHHLLLLVKSLLILLL
jgi:hypothetical protein